MNRRVLIGALVILGLAMLAATGAALAWRRQLRHDREVAYQYWSVATDSLKVAQSALAADDLHGAVAAVESARRATEVHDTFTLRARDYDGGLDAYNAGLHASLKKARAACHALEEAKRKLQETEEAFAKAVDIVQRRAVERYDEAIALCDAIPKTSPLYADAQTYLHWIISDRKVREAMAAKRRHDYPTARRLLLEALENPELGPDARASVQKRIDALEQDEKADDEDK
jgi:hypothetical protein